MKWYLMAFKKYMKFSGRSSRKEYWMFMLIHYTVITVIVFIISNSLDELGRDDVTSLFTLDALSIYIVITIIPSIAIKIRRLHDIDRSGSWFFIQMIPYVGAIWFIVLMCFKGSKGNNRYGDDPYADKNDPNNEYVHYKI